MTDLVLPEALAGVEPVRSVRTPIRMTYRYTPGQSAQDSLWGFADKKILGQRSPVDGAVFVPGRGVDPRHGIAIHDTVELPDTGHVGSFCVTRVPIPGRDDLTLPYISAWIFLDGANVGFLGLVGECDPADARIGMRVQAVWKDDADLGPTAENIRWWRPTGAPDIPFERAGVRGWRHDATHAADPATDRTPEEAS